MSKKVFIAKVFTGPCGSHWHGGFTEMIESVNFNKDVDFNICLRAYRLAYRWNEHASAFMRMSPKGHHTLVEFVPPAGFAGLQGTAFSSPAEWVYGWSDELCTRLGACPPIRAIRRVKRAFSILIDDDGRIVHDEKEAVNQAQEEIVSGSTRSYIRERRGPAE